MDKLKDKSLLTIFALAPAGFGHLRVTDALIEGFPKDARHPLILGAHDEFIRRIHRFFSNNPVGLRIFEWFQHGVAEDAITFFYRVMLLSRSQNVYRQLLTILDQRIDKPSQIIVIATHFGLAHQIGYFKKKFEEENKIKLTLIVQVTDDSPQHIWYVPQADCIFVPSSYTKLKLAQYAKSAKLPLTNIEVISYPISPILGKEKKHDFCQEKCLQLKPDCDERIHVVIPISGAAVGMSFFQSLVDELHRSSHRYFFHIIAKSTSYTQQFLNSMLSRPYVDLHVGTDNRDVVNAYEEVYKKHMISLEITKPSEQAFKALLHPSQLGGSILLFSKPIGRQEYDNIAFLRHHHLIPQHGETLYLWNRAKKNLTINSEEGHKIKHQIGRWRGMKIPHSAVDAARYIHYCLERGILLAMMNCEIPHVESDPELRPDGVAQFWQKINDLL